MRHRAPRDLAGARCFLVDMDGTFLVGNHLLPGAARFIEVLRRRGRRFLFLTNNSVKNARNYADKITRAGVPVSPDQIFTSCEAMALTLQSRYPGAHLFVFGMPALEEELKDHGFIIDAKSPDVAVLGSNIAFTYDTTWQLCDWVRAGLPYLATHPDPNCPVDEGLQPDVGSMIAFVKASTGRDPDLIVGKPNKTYAETAARKVGLTIAEMALIGDRLPTDIALGHTSGITTALVLSGETDAGELEGSPHQPDFVFEGIGQVADWLEQHGS